MKTKVYDLKTQYEEGMNAAAEEIQRGGLVIFPTETVYGIGANAFSEEAVAGIFRAKGRPQDNPLIVHVADIAGAESAAHIPEEAHPLMDAFWPGPLTLVMPKREILGSAVTAGLDTVGIRMPAHPAARDLIARAGVPIAAPSANISGRPSATNAAHALEDFDGRVNIILDGGESAVGVESTVCVPQRVPLILRPGGVTPEMIKEICGSVEVSSAVMRELKEGEAAPSPGMKHKHYSPRAEVYIAEGEAIAKKIKAMYDIEEARGRKAAVICPENFAGEYGARRIYPVGEGAEGAARKLFATLRQLDEDGIDVAYFHGIDRGGMGLAVMNRAMRSAGFKVI